MVDTSAAYDRNVEGKLKSDNPMGEDLGECESTEVAEAKDRSAASVAAEGDHLETTVPTPEDASFIFRLELRCVRLLFGLTYRVIYCHIGTAGRSCLLSSFPLTEDCSIV